MKLLTHKRMLDAAVLRLDAWFAPSGDQVWRVSWFNRRGVNLGQNDIFLVKKKELENWYAIEV